MKFFDRIINLFSQNQCLFCNTRFDVFDEEEICENCRKTLPYIKETYCEKCGRKLDIVYGEHLCHDCKDEKRVFSRNISTFEYKDKVRESIIMLKFNKNQIWRAKALGKELSKTILERYDGIKFDMIIPVPISTLRYFVRGYNQSEEIAEEISKNINCKLETRVLKKIKNNKKQSNLTKKQRIENVKGVYKVKNSDSVEDKIILLIDDIFTTGSTVSECAKILKECGASAIFTATVSIT